MIFIYLCADRIFRYSTDIFINSFDVVAFAVFIRMVWEQSIDNKNRYIIYINDNNIYGSEQKI